MLVPELRKKHLGKGREREKSRRGARKTGDPMGSEEDMCSQLHLGQELEGRENKAPISMQV